MLKSILIFMLFSLQYHHHITMTSVNYSPGSDSLIVFVKIDHNLLMKDYQQTINDDIDVEQMRRYGPFPADMASDYINSRLILAINGELVRGKLSEIKLSDGYIHFSIVYLPEKKPKTMTLTNTFLAGLYPDVENLTIIKTGNIEKGIKFTLQYNKETFRLR